MWWYDPRAKQEVLWCDLWGAVSGEGPERHDGEVNEPWVEYEGVFQGNVAIIARKGPFEKAIGSKEYSGAYEFIVGLSEGGGEIILVPGLGLVSSSLGDPISRSGVNRRLIEYKRGATVVFALTAISTCSWGKVKATVDAKR